MAIAVSNTAAAPPSDRLLRSTERQFVPDAARDWNSAGCPGVERLDGFTSADFPALPSPFSGASSREASGMLEDARCPRRPISELGRIIGSLALMPDTVTDYGTPKTAIGRYLPDTVLNERQATSNSLLIGRRYSH